MAEALNDLGHEVDVIAPYHPAIAPNESKVRVHYFRYIWPDAWAIMGYAQAMESDRKLRLSSYLLAPSFAMAEYVLLRRLMERRCYDIIHAHWVIPNAFVASFVARSWSVPLVISTHGSDIFFAKKQPALGALARWTFSRASAVTACSPDLQQGAQMLGADASRVHLIPWGADVDRFQLLQPSNDLRDRLGLQADQLVILSLGRLVRKKGVEYLIRAMTHVAYKHPNICCLIGGEGPEKAALQQLATVLGVGNHVHFVGAIPWDQVPQYLHLCDLFVVPSIHDEHGNVDGMPTTILEAMAAAKPVVGSNVAGIPLVVSHGESGLLVEEQNVDDLARSLINLLESPELRRQYGENALYRVRQELNWQRVARNFVSLYESGLAEVRKV
jgi:glycosyltransferase involved in cell wall biosynthesis